MKNAIWTDQFDDVHQVAGGRVAHHHVAMATQMITQAEITNKSLKGIWPTNHQSPSSALFETSSQVVFFNGVPRNVRFPFLPISNSVHFSFKI